MAQYVCLEEKEVMEKLILFHGTPDEIVIPTYSKGKDKHGYGKGFYLTENIDLAKEWAVWVFSTVLRRNLRIQSCTK